MNFYFIIIIVPHLALLGSLLQNFIVIFAACVSLCLQPGPQSAVASGAESALKVDLEWIMISACACVFVCVKAGWAERDGKQRIWACQLFFFEANCTRSHKHDERNKYVKQTIPFCLQFCPLSSFHPSALCRQM